MNLAHNAFLDQAIVDHVFIVVRAPAPEEVDQGLAGQLGRKVLPETHLQLFDLQEAVFVVVNVFDGAPHFGHLVGVLRHYRPDVRLVHLLQAFELQVVLHLLLLLLNGNQVINPFSLARQSGRNQVLDIDEALAELVGIVFNISVHFERFKYRSHLLLGEPLVGELLKQLAELVEGDAVPRLDDLAREELPLLLRHLGRNLVEQVD